MVDKHWMLPLPPPHTPTASASLADRWAMFVGRHLYDYNARALRRWLLLAASGALALLWAVWQVVALPWVALAQVQLGVLLVDPVFIRLQSLHRLFKRQAVESTAFPVDILGNASQRVESMVLQKENNTLRTASRLDDRFVCGLGNFWQQACAKQRTDTDSRFAEHFPATDCSLHC